MEARVVHVVGGGPAGLFAARLLKLAHPGWDVRVHERLPAEQTFGFGVGLSARTLDSVRRADAGVAADLVAAAHRYSTGEFRLPRGTVQIPGFHSGVAIGRAVLLRLLARRAEDAGVKIEAGNAPPVDELAAESDLVIGADGVNSAVRAAHEHRFALRIDVGRGNFFWCGSSVPLDGTVFAPVITDSGVFTAHAYPYAAGRSTFVIEASDAALRRAGLDGATFDRDAASDERSLAYLSDLFSSLLRGTSFLGNRSRWTHFRTVRCEHWAAGNVVLIGDAAATAHPTIGSGTKLALESAIALAHSLDGSRPIATSLALFEHTRRPFVERFQQLARHSQLWWESFEHRLDLEPSRIAAAFLSRAGAVSLDDLLDTGPNLAIEATAAYAGTDPSDIPATGLTDWVLSRPLHVSGMHYAGRVVAEIGPALAVTSGDAWGPYGDALVGKARRLTAGRRKVVTLTGGSGHSEVLDRLAVGERLRRDAGVVVQISAPRLMLGEVADGLVAGRTDLVCLSEPSDPRG